MSNAVVCPEKDCKELGTHQMRMYLGLPARASMDGPLFFCKEHVALFSHWYSLYQPEWCVTGRVKELKNPPVETDLMALALKLQELDQAILWRTCLQVQNFLFLTFLRTT